MSYKFLRQDGLFQPVAGGDINISTSTTTGFLTYIANSLTSNVTLTTTAVFDGPTVSQGSSGTWFATGTVTVGDLSGLSDFDVKLWDGTTVIASVHGENVSPNYGAFSLSGIIASPAGNLRISVAADVGGSKCVMYYNASGFSADCTITAVRIG